MTFPCGRSCCDTAFDVCLYDVENHDLGTQTAIEAVLAGEASGDIDAEGELLG